MNASLTLLGRIGLALIFIVAGWGKISGYEGTQQYMQAMGVPGALLPLVILLELGGGLAIATGFLTRWVAIALAVFSVVTAFIFHGNFGDAAQATSFWKNVYTEVRKELAARYPRHSWPLDPTTAPAERRPRPRARPR